VDRYNIVDIAGKYLFYILKILAVRERYSGEVTTVRVDTLSMSLQAFKKAEGEKKWTKCPERVPLPPGILLPGYNPREHFVLPPLLLCEGAEAVHDGAPMGGQ
jgi:hypothetical protein